MKVLTVKQYWAWAIAEGHKRVENRTWQTSHRGPLAIHAGMETDPESLELLEDLGLSPPEELAHGAIVAVVDLIECTRYTPHVRPALGQEFDEYDLGSDPFASGPWCWIFGAVTRLDEPIPLRGQLGLFECPDRLPGLAGKVTKPR